MPHHCKVWQQEPKVPSNATVYCFQCRYRRELQPHLSSRNLESPTDIWDTNSRHITRTSNHLYQKTNDHITVSVAIGKGVNMSTLGALYTKLLDTMRLDDKIRYPHLRPEKYLNRRQSRQGILESLLGNFTRGRKKK